MKYIIFNLVVFLFSIICYGQDLSDNKKAIDSLRNIITKTSDYEKIRILYEDIIKIQYSTDIDGILESTNALKNLESTGKCKTCLAVAQLYEAMHYYLKGDLDKAIPIYELARLEADKVNERYVSNKSLTMLSAINFFQNNYSKATEYANILIENEMASDSITSGLYDGYFMKGLINDDQSYFSLAIKNYIKADSVNNLLKGNNYKIAQSKLYNNLAIVFIQKKDFDKASYYLNNIYDYYLSENNTEGIYSSKQNLGYLEVEKSNYLKAIKILNETGSYYKEIKNARGESEANYLLGRAYFGSKNYKKAIYHLKVSLQTFKESGSTVETGLNYNYLGDSYLALGNLNESEANLLKALEIFNEATSHRNQINCLKSFVKLNISKNRFIDALSNYKQIDSINSIYQVKQNEKQVFELETLYQTEKKEKEIKLLTSQNELAQQQQKNQRNLLLAGIGFTTLTGLFFFFQYRNRQKTNTKLKELDKAKSTFFANISHEFRTPLTLIRGPIDDQLQTATLAQKDRKNLLVAKTNAIRLEALVEQLLALSKLESGNLKLQVQPGNLTQFVNAQIEAFSFSAKEKNISLEFVKNNKEDIHWFDRDALEKILFNLIGNAVKYTPEKGSVIINTQLKNGHYTVSVSNSGNYIEATHQEKVFARFYQTSNENSGTGIGLALTKELVELHKGTIKVSSEKGGYTVFELEIPTNKEAFKAPEILSEALYKETTEDFSQDIIIEDSIITATYAPVLLIVEDNTELRAYIQSIFEGNFLIHTAKNGKEGLEMALAYIPDVIISDVMMPEGDGLSFTKKLKNHQLTSHIPVLLLTAKAEEADKLKGIETGADAYITKPFGSKILKATLQNLLENRRKLQDRFSQELILTPKEIAITSADEQFLNRLQKVLDQELTNPDFSSSKFFEEMGVSRMQLHRKLKALTGQSTSEFLRSQRLKAAVQLIKQEKISISEVGYAVGFNDPSYFTKCFKQEYGVSPTEYIKKS